MLRKFSPSEVEEIFYKAAAIDLQLKDSLSLEQLQEIAFESGISAEALELAIEEVAPPQQLDLNLKRELPSNLKAHFAWQNLSLHNQQTRRLIYTIGVFVAGRLGIVIIQYLVNTQTLFSELSYKYLLGVIAYVLEFYLEVMSVLAAISFPLVLAFTLFNINFHVSENETDKLQF